MLARDDLSCGIELDPCKLVAAIFLNAIGRDIVLYFDIVSSIIKQS